MNIENISQNNEKNSSDSSNEQFLYELLGKREDFFNELNNTKSVEDLEEVLKKYSFVEDGESVTPFFMEETESFAKTIPHDGLWVLDTTIPLNRTLSALEDYRQGHLSEQQLYHALGMEYNAVAAMQRITGVQWDSNIQAKISDGEIPDRGGDKETIEVDYSMSPKAIE